MYFRKLVTHTQVVSIENADALQLLHNVKSNCTNSSRGQVAGYTSLHCTKCFLLKASLTKNTAKFLLNSLGYESWSNGSQGFMGFYWAYRYRQDAAWWKLGTLGWKHCHVPGFMYKDATILPFTKVNIAKRGFPASRYQGPIPTSHYQGWVQRKKSLGNPFFTAYCPSSRAPFSPSFPPKGKKQSLGESKQRFAKKIDAYQPKRLQHRLGIFCTKLIVWEQ